MKTWHETKSNGGDVLWGVLVVNREGRCAEGWMYGSGDDRPWAGIGAVGILVFVYNSIT